MSPNKTILKELLFLSIIYSSFSFISSCNTPVENTKNFNTKQPVSSVGSNSEMVKNGVIKLTVDKSLFQNNSKNKELDFNKSLKKLILEVNGLGIKTPLTQTVKWEPDKNASFSLPVPEGNNRILVLSAFDEDGKIIGTFMGSLNVKGNQDNNVKINPLDTIVGQTLLSILNSSNSKLLADLSLDDLKAYFTKITGFDASNNSFNKITPGLVNTVFIADSIVKTGKIPSEASSVLQKTGSIKVNLNQSGAKLFLSDLNSGIISSTSSNQTTIDGVTFGEWYLSVIKDGFVGQAVKVNINDASNSVSVDLPQSQLISPVISDKPVDIKVLEPIKDKDFGITINNFNFTSGLDEDKNGGEDKYSSGSVAVPGQGSHNIKIKSEIFPAMSNKLDTLTITDQNAFSGMGIKGETTFGDLIIQSDHELQYISVTQGSYNLELEANLDGSWTITTGGEETVINTVKDIENFILKHIEMKNISLHSLAALYTLANTREVPEDIKPRKTLSITGPVTAGIAPPANNYYDSAANVRELLKKVYTAVKNLSALFSTPTKK